MIEKLNLPVFVEGVPTDETDYVLSRDIVMIEKKLNEIIDHLNNKVIVSR